jgi:hypothetical protein
VWLPAFCSCFMSLRIECLALALRYWLINVLTFESAALIIRHCDTDRSSSLSTWRIRHCCLLRLKGAKLCFTWPSHGVPCISRRNVTAQNSRYPRIKPVLHLRFSGVPYISGRNVTVQNSRYSSIATVHFVSVAQPWRLMHFCLQ